MANLFDRYLEGEVLGADPIKLVNLLYRGAIDAIASARRSLASGDIPSRSRQVTRAWEILQELAHTLDHEKGGEISRSLAELYAYAQQRILDGNATQQDAPLAEAEALLTTLAEAWRDLAPVPAPPPQVAYVPVSCSV